jgi:UDP-N-acetylmuramyl pentapeptide phosphotransferase/UDP-N-acetylglucosamine-1-phosphate transferase
MSTERETTMPEPPGTSNAEDESTPHHHHHHHHHRRRRRHRHRTSPQANRVITYIAVCSIVFAILIFLWWKWAASAP